jgi:hypothetical protein
MEQKLKIIAITGSAIFFETRKKSAHPQAQFFVTKSTPMTRAINDNSMPAQPLCKLVPRSSNLPKAIVHFERKEKRGGKKREKQKIASLLCLHFSFCLFPSHTVGSENALGN